ncbi:MAG: hypothetical protein ACP5GH_00855 [Nitrososphaeria archaeon]
MSSRNWKAQVAQYIEELSDYYGLQRSALNEKDCMGLKLRKEDAEVLLILSGSCGEQQGERVEVVWDIQPFTLDGERVKVDVSGVELFLRGRFGIGADKPMYQKSYRDFLKTDGDLASMRDMTENVLGPLENQFENLLVRAYAVGRMLVKRTSIASESSYVRERLIKVAQDLGLLQLTEVVPSGQYNFYVYALTPVGVTIAQKLAEETFTAKQSIVGIWLDRHDPATAYLTAFAVAYSSIYSSYPNCCLLRRDPTRVDHIPCVIKGRGACEKLLESKLPPSLALFADTLLYSDAMSEMLYNVMYELTASYLASILKTELGGRDQEVYCIVPDLTRAILDSTRDEFIKRFQQEQSVKELASVAAAVLAVKDGYTQESIKYVTHAYGLNEKELQSVVNEMIASGILKENYAIQDEEKLKGYIKAHAEEAASAVGLY